MSTILTALKKAQDNADLAKSQGAEIKVPEPVFKRTVAVEPKGRSKPPVVFIALLCGCLVVVMGLGGWLYWMNDQPEGPVDPGGRPLEISDQAIKQTAPAPPALGAELPGKKPAFIPPPLEMAESEPVDPVPPSQPPAPLKIREFQRPLPEPEPAVVEIPQAQSATKNIPVPDQAPQKMAYPMADSTLLDLQAISWSKDPSQRIAVINDKILGENERVQGYLVLHIEPDQVVLKNPDGRQVSLPFKYQ